MSRHWVKLAILEDSLIVLLPSFSKWKPFQPCPGILFHWQVVMLRRSSKGMQKRKNPHPLVYLVVNASLAQVCQVNLQTKKSTKRNTHSRRIAWYRTQEYPGGGRLRLNFAMYLQLNSGNYFRSILSSLKGIYGKSLRLKAVILLESLCTDPTNVALRKSANTLQSPPESPPAQSGLG